MSNYVYEDVARKKKILAKTTTERNKGIRYYCPNPKCNARMFLWSLHGESKPFFRASGKPGHVQYCPHGSDNTYNPEKMKEEGFNAEEAIANLMIPVARKETKGSQPKHLEDGIKEETVVPHTIKQIYDMCKAHHWEDTFNGKPIGQILVDTRNMFMYSRGLFGYRLVEAKCKKCLYDEKTIFLETPINNVQYELQLCFENMSLYKEIRKLLYDNRNHVIVIAGNWKKSKKYNSFTTAFNCKCQIKVLKRMI